MAKALESSHLAVSEASDVAFDLSGPPGSNGGCHGSYPGSDWRVLLHVSWDQWTRSSSRNISKLS